MNPTHTPSLPPREAESKARIKAIEKSLALYESYLIGFFHRRIKDYQIAEDLAQEVWLAVYKTFEIDQIGHIRLILVKAKQVLSNHRRKLKVRDFLAFPSSLPESEVTFDEMTEKSSTEADAKERFWEQFPKVKLSDDQKDAFWLSTYYGYTLDEISSMFGKPLTTIHEWIKRVRKECSESYEA